MYVLLNIRSKEHLILSWINNFVWMLVLGTAYHPRYLKANHIKCQSHLYSIRRWIAKGAKQKTVEFYTHRYMGAKLYKLYKKLLNEILKSDNFIFPKRLKHLWSTLLMTYVAYVLVLVLIQIQEYTEKQSRALINAFNVQTSI